MFIHVFAKRYIVSHFLYFRKKNTNQWIDVFTLTFLGGSVFSLTFENSVT